MRHAPTKAVYRYWNELVRVEGDRPRYPVRAQIEPAALKRQLGDVFVLHRPDGSVRYRIAGTRVCAIHGRELTGLPFLQAFDGADRTATRSWVSTFGAEAVPLLFATNGFNARGDRVALETLILPLANSSEGEGDPRRALGVCAPDPAVAWIGMEPVVRQEVTGVRVLRPWLDPLPRGDVPLVRPAPPRTVAAHADRRSAPVPAGRKVAHLIVLEGGASG